MRKAAGMMLVLLGAVLIGSALLLFSYNRQQETVAGIAAEEKLEELRQRIEMAAIETVPEEIPEEPISTEETVEESEKPEENEDIPETQIIEEILPVPEETEPPETEPKETEPEEPRVEIDGYEYIGYLYIEAIQVEVPVMADYDYQRLDIAPCRQFGSVRTNDLVVAGHDYRRHFANIGKLKEGDKILFTDVNGTNYEYAVEKIEILEADAVDAVQNSGSDLVLYTCTYTGTSRITVFSSRTESAETEDNG